MALAGRTWNAIESGTLNDLKKGYVANSVDTLYRDASRIGQNL